eukprot:gene166-2361_t
MGLWESIASTCDEVSSQMTALTMELHRRHPALTMELQSRHLLNAGLHLDGGKDGSKGPHNGLGGHHEPPATLAPGHAGVAAAVGTLSECKACASVLEGRSCNTGDGIRRATLAHADFRCGAPYDGITVANAVLYVLRKLRKPSGDSCSAHGPWWAGERPTPAGGAEPTHGMEDVIDHWKCKHPESLQRDMEAENGCLDQTEGHQTAEAQPGSPAGQAPLPGPAGWKAFPATPSTMYTPTGQTVHVKNKEKNSCVWRVCVCGLSGQGQWTEPATTQSGEETGTSSEESDSLPPSPIMTRRRAQAKTLLEKRTPETMPHASRPAAASATRAAAPPASSHPGSAGFANSTSMPALQIQRTSPGRADTADDEPSMFNGNSSPDSDTSDSSSDSDSDSDSDYCPAREPGDSESDTSVRDRGLRLK